MNYCVMIEVYKDAKSSDEKVIYPNTQNWTNTSQSNLFLKPYIDLDILGFRESGLEGMYKALVSPKKKEECRESVVYIFIRERSVCFCL